MAGKQEQSADRGALAIQAGRDVHYYGLSVADVRELCTVLFQQNFPVLREDARKTAAEYVRNFAETLDAKLVSCAERISFDKFREPEVQAVINDAVVASARKGPLAHPEMLAELIAARVIGDVSDYKTIILSEAISIAPKLTKKHLELVSFVHLMKSLSQKVFPSLSALEDCGHNIDRNLGLAYEVVVAEFDYVVYTRLLTQSMTNLGEVWEFLPTVASEPRIGPSGPSDKAKCWQDIKASAHSFALAFDNFAESRLWSFDVSPVGKVIACAYITKFMPEVEL